MRLPPLPDKLVNRRGGLCLGGSHVNKAASVFAFAEHYHTVNECVNGVILAHAHVFTGMVHSATLALDDVAGFGKLTTKNLNSESFAF